MQNNLVNHRRSHRFPVCNMGYVASIAIDEKAIDCPVRDFSATGIQIETPLSIDIPQEGTLLYRNDSYHYVVKHVRLEGISKKIGLETSVVPVEESVFSDHCSRNNRRQTLLGSSRGILSLNWESSLLWTVAALGLCVVWALLFRSTNVANGHDADSFWSKLAGTTKYSQTETRRKVSKDFQTKEGLFQWLTKIRVRSSVVNNAIGGASEAVNRASEFLKTADYEAAIRACDQALSFNRQLAAAWHFRGVALNKLARNTQAINDLRQALSLDASDPMIHAALAQALCDEGNFDEGVSQILRGFELTKGDLRSRFKQQVADTYEARAAERLRNGDRPGAESDKAQAS